MKSADALHELEHLLATRGLSIETLSVTDGVDAMLDFYRSTRADDCDLDADGDMLLFQWGTLDAGAGARFEVDITRQFIRNDGEDDDIWQLSLTFVFQPIATAARGNRWCATPADLDDFASFVQSHVAYTSRATPVGVELDFEAAG